MRATGKKRAKDRRKGEDYRSLTRMPIAVCTRAMRSYYIISKFIRKSKEEYKKYPNMKKIHDFE